MCGIVGVVSTRPVDRALVECMRDRVAHRGPDHAGLWSTPDLCVCLSHRRLAIIDLAPEANQPFLSHDGRFAITFNGEIYNYRAVRADLQALGARFATQSDTEVLVEAYRAWGDEALDRLSGMYAFAIWDTQERRLFCARDRAGEKPFYYMARPDAFVFASEPKAFVEWPAFERRVDYTAVIDFLSFGYVPDPKCIWAGCHKLAPGHSLTVTIAPNGDVCAGAPRRYWSLSFEPGATSPTSWDEAIREALSGAADEMAVSDVPLGTFLSGGVDSSAVTAALSRAGHEVRSFTVGFSDPAYDERPWARQVADQYHTSHTERLVVPNDVPSLLDRMIWHFDEPFNDYSYLPTYCLCREARQAITVALSGDGADELFAGYRKYQRLGAREELSWLLPRRVAQLAAGASDVLLDEGSRWRRTLGQYAADAATMLADSLTIGFRYPLLKEIARGPLAAALRDYSPYDLVSSRLADAPPKRVGLINAMRHLDFTISLPGDMLVKVDRASMAVALEVRPLFLNRRVMELAARIPAGKLAGRTRTKAALKDALRPWLPAALLDRRKQGFAMPLGSWLRGGDDAGRLIRSPVRDRRLDDWLDLDRIAALAASHDRGDADFTSQLHAVFFLERWMNAWLPA